MRILITSIVDLRKTSHNRLHQFIRHLSRNHSITVLSVNDWWKTGQTDVSQYQKGVEDILEGIDVNKYFTNRKISPYLQEAFSTVTLGKVLRGIDYTSFDVHLNYNTLLSGYFVARKLKSAGINTVYDIADDLPQMIRNSPQIPPPLRPLGRLVGAAMVNKNIKIASKVTCITTTLPDSRRIPRGKFELVPNGVDTDLFQNYPSAELRARLGIAADFVVGYVGVLREWVDFEPVFAAISKIGESHRRVKVLIVGGEGGQERTKNLASKYQIRDKVIFTGTVPYTMVPQYISCMDACLIPFRANAVGDGSLPLKLFEYMSCEKPVVCGRLAGVSQVVGSKVLYASSIPEYSKHLTELITDNGAGLRDRMGKQGRELVKRRFGWAGIGSRLETVLEEARRAGK